MTAAKPIRLVLAGNNSIVLACLERLLAIEENFAVIARCGRGEDVLGVLRALQPDILLLDLPPSFRERLALLHGMKEAALPTRVIFLAETLGEGELAHATRLGVRGIVPKEVAPLCSRSASATSMPAGSGCGEQRPFPRRAVQRRR